MKLIIILCLLFHSIAFAQNEFALKHALEVIETTYGDKVRIKPKTLLKFGHSEQVSNVTFTTIEDRPTGSLNETFVSSNIITHVSSSSGSDTGTITIEGHTIDSNGEFTFVVQSVTLQGQTSVALAKPLARSTRLYNTGSSDFVGDVYVYESDTVTAGVPQTGAKVHLLVHAADSTNQTLKASTTISKDDYWIVTEAFGSINEKTGSPIVEMRLEIRNKGGVFRTAAIASFASAGGVSGGFRFDPPVIVPKNSDVRLRALASGSGLKVSGWINGYLAKIEK